jgi:hypothetical protein
MSGPKARLGPHGYRGDHRSPKKQVSHGGYFNCDEIEEKVVLSFGPMPFTVAIMASAMPPAIRLYSMAVAPDSSAKNWRSFSVMAGSLR